MSLHTFALGYKHATKLYALPQKQILKRRVRFLLKCLLWHRSASQWFGFLEAEPELRRLSQINPQIGGKPLSRYMRRGWRVGHRLRCIIDHYEMMLSVSKGRLILEIAHDCHAVAQFKGDPPLSTPS
ncbi:DUF535 family protein [Rhizobium rhizogenes]|uniref:DUF535 family protein n=1 Tax=Rhizobium rhizogenes TaxID=359 RepID=UPI0038685C86